MGALLARGFRRRWASSSACGCCRRGGAEATGFVAGVVACGSIAGLGGWGFLRLDLLLRSRRQFCSSSSSPPSPTLGFLGMLLGFLSLDLSFFFNICCSLFVVLSFIVLDFG